MARLGFFLPHMPRPGIELVSFQLHLINGPYLERFTSLSYRLNSSKAFQFIGRNIRRRKQSLLFSLSLLSDRIFLHYVTSLMSIEELNPFLQKCLGKIEN